MATENPIGDPPVAIPQPPIAFTPPPKRRGRPPKVAIQSPAQAGEKPTAQIPQPEQSLAAPVLSSFDVHDVVQVVNPNSPFFGVLFQIGDMQTGQVHGFHMMSGGKREYVTVGTDECKMIGPSKVRSKDPTSPQWKMDHKKA